MIDYEEYVAEQLSKSIAYSEYVALRRKKKIKNLFK